MFKSKKISRTFAKKSVWRDCPSCNGKGTQKDKIVVDVPLDQCSDDQTEMILWMMQGVCLACQGDGGSYHEVIEETFKE